MFLYSYIVGTILTNKKACWSLLLILTVIYLFILQIWKVWSFTIDDMYITLRYAKNWVDGYGLVWNIEHPPVEGYSNFSFVLLARIAMSLHYNPVVVLKAAGVIGLSFTCWAVYAISRTWFVRSLALIPCFWLLAYRGQILWSVSGLETTIYEALICFAVVFIFRGIGRSSCSQSNRSISFVIAGLLLAFAGMTRPEAPALMALFVFLLLFLRAPSSDDKTWQILALFCATFIICFAPYFLWRWQYYGRLFPNPVYCKGFTNILTFELDKNYLRLMWPFGVMALPAIWKNNERRYYFLWLPSVVYLILLIGADPIVAFDNRLFLPAFALLLPLTLKGMATLLTPYFPKKEAFNLAMYFGAFLMAFFFIPMLSLAGYRHFTENPLAGERLRQNVVMWLENNAHSNSRVVLADSGLIPYKSANQFIDSYCLNNAEMTKLPPALMYQHLCENVLKTKPEVIILTSLLEDGKVTYTPADVCLSTKLAHNNGYCLQRNFGTGDRHYFYRYEIFTACKASK